MGLAVWLEADTAFWVVREVEQLKYSAWGA